MSEEQNINQDNSITTIDTPRGDSCTDCNVSPCVCSKKPEKKENVARTTPPKISWI